MTTLVWSILSHLAGNNEDFKKSKYYVEWGMFENHDLCFGR